VASLFYATSKMFWIVVLRRPPKGGFNTLVLALIILLLPFADE
jgi:hypothetical protein